MYIHLLFYVALINPILISIDIHRRYMKMYRAVELSMLMMPYGVTPINSFDGNLLISTVAFNIESSKNNQHFTEYFKYINHRYISNSCPKCNIFVRGQQCVYTQRYVSYERKRWHALCMYCDQPTHFCILCRVFSRNDSSVQATLYLQQCIPSSRDLTMTAVLNICTSIG